MRGHAGVIAAKLLLDRGQEQQSRNVLAEALRANPVSVEGLQLRYAMLPAASVSGLYFAHPEARYFNLGKVNRDQVASYAERKGIDIRAAERLLSANLAYDPD